MEGYYTIERWLAFFFIYSFLGWCIESTIVSASKRKLTNRGFLKGPMLPLYGFGALTIIISTLMVADNAVLVYICGMIAATALEYVTGAAMEAIFNMKYWDYSDKKFNIHGYICLKSSLFWGFLSVVLVMVIHVPIAEFIDSLDIRILTAVLLVIIVIAATDTVFAFKKALDYQKLLAYESMIKKELSEISERLAEAKEAFTEKATAKQIEYFSNQEQKVERLRLELDAAKEKAGKLHKSLLKSFPSASSKRFGEAFEEIKKYVSTKKQ